MMSASEKQNGLILRPDKLELEKHKLELMSQGKLQPPDVEESAVLVPPTPSFDIVVNLRLVPKFNEKDPDIFFVLLKVSQRCE